MGSLAALFSSKEESSAKNRDNFSVRNHISDELLIEILIRLPTSKSAAGFKLVSKRWCSLISTSYFVSQFTTHHNNINKKKDYHAAYQFTNHSAVFLSPRSLYKQRKEGSRPSFITGKENPIFESPGFTFKFLPVEKEFVSVVASCNDLLLCETRNEYSISNFYICNPFTMQWLPLIPPAPMKRYNTYFGLVYEPNYYQEGIEGKYQCQFKVVCVQNIEKDSFYIHVYCSETRQWSKSPLLGAEYRVSSNVVAHDRKLLWYNGREVVAYDPFNNETFSMDVSDSQVSNINNDKAFVNVCLGISQGTLQVMKLVTNLFNRDAGYLCVWEVKDSEARCLSLKHRIFLNSVNYLCSFSDLRPLAFHPDNKDVVYFFINYKIIQLKIERGKLEVVGEILEVSNEFVSPWMVSNNFYVLTTMLPWWPTPVQMLQ